MGRTVDFGRMHGLTLPLFALFFTGLYDITIKRQSIISSFWSRQSLIWRIDLRGHLTRDKSIQLTELNDVIFLVRPT